MFSKGPKNTAKYYWTNHVKFKMQYYSLSAQKVLSVISRPARKEEGIVEKTVAVMKPVNPKIINNKTVWKQEVWVMYQKKIKDQKSNLKIKDQKSNLKIKDQNSKINNKSQIKIISAWRYPGVSPKKNPIPKEIIREIVGTI